MSIKLFYHHTKYEVDRSNGVEIIWNWNFSQFNFWLQDAGGLFVKWSPGSKTHKNIKFLGFSEKKNFFFGRKGRKHRVTKLILWLNQRIFFSTDMHYYKGGKQHNTKQCSYIETICHFCNKKGHLEVVCKRKQYQQRNQSSSSVKCNKKAELIKAIFDEEIKE